MNIFLDLETLTVNRKTTTPSQLKTTPFSVAYAVDKSLKVHIRSNLTEFIFNISAIATKNKVKKVKIYAHNTSKYDSHFILSELIKNGFKKSLNIKENMNLPNDANAKKQGSLNNYECLELRYKSSNKLSLCWKLNDIFFEVIDTFPKTLLSLANIGKRLHQLDILDEQYLKSDFDYTKYDLLEDLSEDDLYTYSNSILSNLSDDELTYIKNDVIILQRLVNNFSKFFDGFSINEFALNGNVINKYTNDKKDKVATHHILNKIYDRRAEDKYYQISYSDYVLDSGINLFKFFKDSYRGGVCFYNDNYVNQTILENVSAYDINSSYPSVLAKQLVPNTIIKYHNRARLKLCDLSYFKSNTYSVISISLDVFKKITSPMKSIFKKINNNYYRTHNNTVNINSLFIDELIDIHSFDQNQTIEVIDVVTFDLCEWGGKSYLKKYYEIKQNSKRFGKTFLEMNSNGEMIDTGRIINVDTSFLTDVSKVLLNSIYGASGISDRVDFFYHDMDDNLIRCEDGIKNNERNIVSSLFVTSFAKYNLLSPLRDLTDLQLSDSFLYCDTDSLYIKDKDIGLVIKNMEIDDNNIGSWGCDSNSITRFKILNHKIYSYYDSNKNKITCKMCGVSKKTINDILIKCDNNWEEFSNNYFYPTCELPSIKSILNVGGTISIYDSKTVLKSGAPYNDELTFGDRIKFFNTINELYNSFNKDININDVGDSEFNSESSIVYYINGGAYSKSEIISIYNEVNNIRTNSSPFTSYDDMNTLINKHYPYFIDKLSYEKIDYELVTNLVKHTKYNNKTRSNNKSKYTCTYRTNYVYEYLSALYELKLFNLVSLKNREYDILRTMLRIKEGHNNGSTVNTSIT